MATILSSSVGAKYQVTLPKKVREALGIYRSGELVGFMVDGSKVLLTKANVTPQGDSFTEDEWEKLLRLARTPVKKAYTATEFRRRHKRWTHR